MSAPARRPYWNPYLGGIALGVVLFLSFIITGHGLGASGGISRVMAALVQSVAPNHVDLTYDWAVMAGGGRHPLDHWLVFAIVGTAAGGFASGALAGRLKLETFRGPSISPSTRWFFAFLGGAIVGWAARMARGCTSGQALSGGAVLSVGSWVFMFSVFAGGYALSVLVRRLWN
ncbi:MAG: YeeE/YedE family protein [Myxococcales bacterium]|nr:YeeE/YedE family protein [Myxococcales bacterium]MCB9646427.1 YeeE/YedE family protein [Deltaproteobacteria bacterium]